MVESKPWYLSRTIWAALISVAASIGSLIGIDIDASKALGVKSLAKHGRGA